ncbi:winged helix-turn-helix transcriptional regulator [Sphingosinicella soli]|uniref:DNA-binding HxlR family transcriptional regulator n=1 Tax=Sphingosinicella soli TaxID=333708 RepID=A0A7W7FAR7_9SPHN|nr:winged helix-turn-helix transcriptional regulator [Sphingosinicella soli]MBB4633953.1 DNA-binding HxlR family transcriptional regulator [Sphingosinicella soli]
MKLDKTTVKLENTTQLSKNTKKRVYHDACGMAHGLELLGDRWALFVVRELMLGPRRFGDLRADLPGISANVLTQRLSELEASGVVVRSKLPPPASVQVYGLTEWGYEAEPIVQELGRWATRSPGHDPTLPISGVSILLSFRTMIDRARIGDRDFTVGFRFGVDEYAARVDRGGIHVERGSATGDLVFSGHPSALAAFVYGGVALDVLADNRALTLRGDPMLAARFADLFVLPPKFHPLA